MESTKSLKEMSLEELKELRRQWYAQAIEDGSIDKCVLVAIEMGEELNARYGPKYLRKTGDLELYVDQWGGYATADYKGREVMSTHPCTRLFLPGDWMKIVETEYPLALAKKLARAAVHSEKERQALIAEMEATGVR